LAEIKVFNFSPGRSWLIIENLLSTNGPTRAGCANDFGMFGAIRSRDLNVEKNTYAA